MVIRSQHKLDQRLQKQYKLHSFSTLANFSKNSWSSFFLFASLSSSFLSLSISASRKSLSACCWYSINDFKESSIFFNTSCWVIFLLFCAGFLSLATYNNNKHDGEDHMQTFEEYLKGYMEIKWPVKRQGICLA